MNVTKKNAIAEFSKQNAIWILGTLFTVGNIYIATLLSPLKEDIRVLAKRTDTIETQTKDFRDEAIQIKLSQQRVEDINDELKEINLSLRRLEDKLDQVK